MTIGPKLNIAMIEGENLHDLSEIPVFTRVTGLGFDIRQISATTGTLKNICISQFEVV